jgi:hypothetical protein
MKLLAAMMLLGLLAGCRATYTIKLDLAPNNEAAVELDGVSANLTVSNRGPGPVDLSFEHDSERSKTTRVQAGADTQTALPCPLVVELVTGEAAAKVVVVARGVGGFRILRAPRPRRSQ